MSSINDLCILIINNNTSHFQKVLNTSTLSQEHLGHLLVYTINKQPSSTYKLLFEMALHNKDANMLLFPRSCSCSSCMSYK